MLLIDDLTAGCLQLVRLSIHDSVFRGHASISDQTLSGRGGGIRRIPEGISLLYAIRDW